jgi:hypothetical protein
MPPHHARTRVTDLRFHVFARPVHPELFEVLRRAEVRERAYCASIAITGQSHAITVRAGMATIVEVVAPPDAPLPRAGERAAAPLAPGARDEVTIEASGIRYRSSLRALVLAPEEYREAIDAALATDRLERLKAFFDADPQMPAMSGFADLTPFALADFRARPRRLDVTTIHADPHASTIVRVETRIEIG